MPLQNWSALNHIGSFNGCGNDQWRIQDFPEEGAPTPQGGANIRFCQNFPKTAWNWKNLDPQGGRASLTPPLDPPLIIVERYLNKNTFQYHLLAHGTCFSSQPPDVSTGRGSSSEHVWTSLWSWPPDVTSRRVGEDRRSLYMGVGLGVGVPVWWAPSYHG